MTIRAWVGLALVVAALAPAAASADQGFTYTGIEGGYDTVPASDNQSATGWYTAGTFQLPQGLEALSLSGAYYNSSGYGETTVSLAAGINYHWSLSDGLDLVSDAFYCRNTTTTSTTIDASNGYALDAGFHVQVTTAWDVNVVIGRQRMAGASINFMQVAPVLDLGNDFSLSLAWQHATDGSSQFTTGIRYDF